MSGRALSNGRDVIRFVPGVTVNTSGLKPRQVQLPGFTATRPISRFILDAPYTVTDAGISAGETFAGVVNKFIIRKRNPKTGKMERVVYAERDCLPSLTVQSIHGAQPGITAQLTSYSDAQPTTAVEQKSFYIIEGPFSPGYYDGIVDMLDVTSEWGGATVFEANITLDRVENMLTLPSEAPVCAMAMMRKFGAVDVDLPPCNIAHVAPAANISEVIVDGVSYATNSITQLRRFNNLLSTTWGGSLADYLTMWLGPRTRFQAKFSAATDIFYGYTNFAPVYVAKRALPKGKVPARREQELEVVAVTKLPGEPEYSLAEVGDDEDSE